MASVDTPEDNKAFAEKEQADFPILADPDKKVANAYGVIPPNRPPDRQFAQRWTFYIDPDGKIAAIDKDVKPRNRGRGGGGQAWRTRRQESHEAVQVSNRRRCITRLRAGLQSCAQRSSQGVGVSAGFPNIPARPGPVSPRHGT